MPDIEIDRTIHLAIFKYENNEFNYIYDDLTDGIVADSLSISEIMIDGEFKFGQVNSNMFEVELINISDISNCYIYAYVVEVKQVNNVPITTLIHLFTGIIDECKYDKHSGSYKITAYDFTYKYGDYDVSALIRRACDFYIEHYSTSFKLSDFISYVLSLIISEFKYPYYLSENFNLVNDLNINIATLYKIKNYTNKHSITFKDLLRQIGEYSLSFVNVDRGGHLEILQTTKQHSESEYLYDEDCELNSTEIYPKNNLFPSTVNIYGIDGTILDTYTAKDGDISFDDGDKFYGSYNITENILFDSIYNTLSGVYTLNYAELLFYVILSTLENVNASIPLIVSRLDTKLGDSFGLWDIEYGTVGIPNFMVYKNELSGSLLINQTISSELSAFSNSSVDEVTSNSQEIEELNNQIADSGWVNVPESELGDKFKFYSSGYVRYRKIGNIVTLQGVVSPIEEITGSQTEYRIFSIPYSPSKTVYGLQQGSGAHHWLLTVTGSSTGDSVNVNFSRYGIKISTNNTITYENVTSSTWLPFHLTYFMD